MKTIIKAIHPKWCEKILNGEKTIELGKGFGNMETPVKVLMYETKNHGGRGKVVGEFICHKITEIEYPIGNNPREIQDGSCLTRKEMLLYSKNETAIIFALHISEVEKYDEPKELSEFGKFCKYNSPVNCDRCKYDVFDDVCEESHCVYGGLIPIEHAPQNFIYCEDLEEK